MPRPTIILAIALLPLILFADPQLDAFSAELTAPNRVFGSAVAPEDVIGRVVVTWNITEFVDPVAKAIENDTELDDKAEAGPMVKLREQIKTLKSVVKSAGRDGRLLVVAVDVMPTDPEKRRTRTAAIRSLKPSFPVYASKVETQLFDAKGTLLVKVKSLKDLTDGDRLTNALKDAPDYLLGRIILFRTKDHEAASKRLVKGKNIEQPMAALRREATGQGEKADEARRMIGVVDAYLKETCDDIEADLKTAPSRAVGRITLFVKTCPSVARRYAGALAALRASPEVKQLGSAREFLAAANAGDIGRGDMGNAADALIKKLGPMSKSESTSIAAEATILLAALSPFSSETLAKVQVDLRNQIRARKAEDRKREEEARQAKRNSQSSNDSHGTKRQTAYSVLVERSGATTLAPLEEELNRIDDATCNYENLRTVYGRYEGQAGPKAEAAKALIHAVDSLQKSLSDDLTRIQKENKPLDLMDGKNWEVLITVNLPGLQTSADGRAALKMLRDSEVRHIAAMLSDVRSGTPTRSEDESNESYAVSRTQYLQTKLKALQKYRKTNTTFGRLCVAQLDAMGFSDSDIEKRLSTLDNTLKEQKKALKATEKRAKDNSRRNRD